MNRGYARDAVRRYALRFGWDDVVAAQCALYERVAEARLATLGATA